MLTCTFVAHQLLISLSFQDRNLNPSNTAPYSLDIALNLATLGLALRLNVDRNLIWTLVDIILLRCSLSDMTFHTCKL